MGQKVYTGSGDDIMIGTLEMPEVRQPVSKRFLYRAAKRISDIVISVLGLAVLSAVFVITALAIALEDGGPVFYAQKRIGKMKRNLRSINSGACTKMPKRSMKTFVKNTDAEMFPSSYRMIQG